MKQIVHGNLIGQFSVLNLMKTLSSQFSTCFIALVQESTHSSSLDLVNTMFGGILHTSVQKE